MHWDEGTFNRLLASQPEPLPSSFRVTHAMLLNVLDRPGDGCAAMKRLLTDNDEDRPAQRRHIRQAIAIYRSLLAAGVLERLDEPDELGRLVRVTADLQEDFALNQPLSLFVLEALPRLDAGSPTWELDVVSVVESTLEDPWPVLAAQLERLRAETLARLKQEGMEYEDRMEVLRELEHPKPLADLLYEAFDTYRLRHPWAARLQRAAQVSGPRPLRALDGVLGVRRALWGGPLRRPLPALPHRHVQGPRAKRP